jgi:proline iminopeptidase
MCTADIACEVGCVTGRWRRVGQAAGFFCVVLLATVAGCAAVVGVAVVVVSPPVFLTVGWIVFALGIVLAARLLPRARRLRAGVVTLVVLTVLGGFALLWPGSGATPAAPAGTEWVSLPTGSRLAYQELHATGTARPTPVVFLHGGPGVADMAGDIPYLRRLADAGWNTYVYDQLGAGRSTRLSDPDGYTMARAVADLDAFRQAIAAPRIDVLGYSWGSTLAAAYLAAHPDRVAEAVFASPGPMVGGASDVTDLLGRPGTHVGSVLAQALQPRALLAWTIDRVNPESAHTYAGDAEMDARFRTISAAAAPALYCHPPSGGSDAGDVGFYANATLLRPAAWRDPHPVLRRLHTPALVIKGSCDYLSWSSAVDYRDTLPDSRMIYLHDAGHRAYAEQPAEFFAVVTAFLAGRPLPLPAYTGTAAPADYQGPHG